VAQKSRCGGKIVRTKRC